MFIGYFRVGVPINVPTLLYNSFFIKNDYKPIYLIFFVARGRIELPTPCFSDKCSTD